MNIDIFSHSSSFGGAESALYALIRSLKIEHKLRVFLPKLKGEFYETLTAAHVQVLQHKFVSALPHAQRLLDQQLFEQGRESVAAVRYEVTDLVLCNTITLPHVAMYAQSIAVPCIIYAHEFIDSDPDLAPNGCSPGYYLKQIERFAAHILCASEFVASQFAPAKSSVLYPFQNDSINQAEQKKKSLTKNIREWTSMLLLSTRKLHFRKLLAIGNKSRRKNFAFSLGVHKSLQMRGVEQTLLLIGNSGTTQLELCRMIRKRKIKKHALLVNELTNPYRHIDGQPINLVSSVVEPFGLTVVESLSRGIPVVSSRCGGPEEILPDEYIYDVENYDQCVKILERVWENYAATSGEAIEIFNKIAAKNTTEKRSAILSAAIGKAIGTHCDCFNKQLCFTVPHTDLISASEILKHIQLAADSRGIEIGTHDIESMIANEQKEPGFAVRGDVEKFDITPFAHSREMDELYRGGIGLGIELATYHQDSGKSKMLNFILLGIREMQSASKDPLKILCLGDGLGLDSITIAASGFQVDYMDYDSSVMSECARLNLKKAMSVDIRIAINVINKVEAAYDCIVCLEVIEHVPNPMSFMTFISDCLNEKGVLYLSECFNGIADRWPTHLYSNEKFSHSILDLSEEHFALTDINQDPMLKPLVFRKKNSVCKSSNQLSGAKRHAFLQHNARLFLGK